MPDASIDHWRNGGAMTTATTVGRLHAQLATVARGFIATRFNFAPSSRSRALNNYKAPQMEPSGRVYRLDFVEFLSGCDGYNEFLMERFHLGPSLLALEDLLYLDLREIPPQLGNLTSLHSLEIRQDGYDLYEGTLHAKSLAWLSRLTSLKHLVLADIDLTGARDWIHAVGNLPSLTHLNLHGCRIPNIIPSRVSNFNSSNSLTFVNLSNTGLKSSSIWTWLFNHTSLVELHLSGNELRGTIPYSFRNMTSLSHLDLSSNQLEGEFQYSVQGLCRLQNLDLSQNNLTEDLSSIFRSLSCAENSLTFLSLHHNHLRGSLPDITKFSSLRKLFLQRNKLDGSLPPSFAKPSSLIILNLQQNQLTGSVPDLSSFRSLKVLQLRNNHLNGSIHLSLGQLSSLEKFDVSLNSLKGHIFATHFSNHSSLRYLDMSFNSLTFNVSYDWVPKFRLETIGLASCKLGSRFPKWLRTQTDYSRLDMSNTGISDTFPLWFWNLSLGATFIGLSHNRFHGILPNSSVVFSSNPAIDLSSNLLEGTIPSFLANVGYLNLSRNSFSGSISFLCHGRGAIFGLDLSHNFLSGKLPDCWTGHNINVLDLSSNSFSGNLPSSFGSLNIGNLHLRDNKFSGKLPLSMANFTDLMSLDIGDNLFGGEIPSWIGHKLHSLSVLSLRNNSFSGKIPSELCNLTSVQIIDLSMNNISGFIPHCLCNLTSMTQKKTTPTMSYESNGTFSSIGERYQDYISLALKGFTYEYKQHLELVKSIDFSSNSLSGDIPAEISCLTGLVSLNLSGNNLMGSITPNVGQLKSLESLDLSNNHLSGEIPSTLSELSFLGTLSLAKNNFSGRIPTGTQIQGFSVSVFAGNPRLCGDPLLKKCIIGGKANGNSDQESLKPENNDKVVSLGLYISIVLGFITGFWVVCGGLVLNKSWRYAFFGFWIHVYDRIYVIVALKMAVIGRQFQS
ncbi:hypothetical protein SOVF_106020 [Spinacia oleracea]|nr:hypothetical protein SOVF_106020 [Spinacia oleracea]